MEPDQTPDQRDTNPLLEPDPSQHPSWARLWVPRLAGAALVIVAVVAFGNWVWDGTQDFLILLVFTVFLAFALEPLVRRLEKSGVKRGLGAAIVLFGSIIALVAVGWAFVSLLVDQFGQIAAQIPVWIESFVTWMNETFGTNINVPESIADAEQITDQIVDWLDDAAGLVINIGSGIAGAIATTFTVATPSSV